MRMTMRATTIGAALPTTTSLASAETITIGSYKTPVWGSQEWLVPLDDFGDDHDYGHLIPSVRNGLSHQGTLFAVPFYAESSFTFY